MTLNLSNKFDSVLKTECVPFDFNNPQIDPIKLFEDLKETMIKFRGLGLAAPQVGLPYRVFVMGDPDSPDTIIPVFNPIITSNMDSKLVELEEGCLTFPGLYIKIKRHENIRARYTNQFGNTDTIKFNGLTARVFQHEFDHLNGVLFQKRASKIRLEQAKKQASKLNRIRKTNKEKQND